MTVSRIPNNPGGLGGGEAPLRTNGEVPRTRQQNEADNPWDLTVLNHSREIYFLPGVDRLAMSIAECSEAPLHVKVECNGQSLEYVIEDGVPKNASLNGAPFEVTVTPGEDGKSKVSATGAPGNYSGTMREDGINVLVNDDMPVAERILWEQNEGSDKVGEIIGNFACARLYEGFYKNEQGLRILGELGRYPLDAQLSKGPNGTLVLEGEFGDLTYRETFTPLSK